jgi:hypothetical protein
MKRHSRIAFSAICAIVVASFIGCGGPQYVKVPLIIPEGKTSGLTEAESKADSLMRKLVSNPAIVEHFKKMFKTAVVEVKDFDSLTFTVKLILDTNAPARAEYVLGSDTATRPDLILPLYSQNIANVISIFEDGQVTDEEAYRIHRATFGSNLKSLFQIPSLYEPKVARYLDLPNFIHMTLKNEKGYEFMGSHKEATVTILNVDGQWLVSPGALGDPDVKWAVTHTQLADFTKLVFEPGKGAATSDKAARERLKEIKAFLESITVYRRP